MSRKNLVLTFVFMCVTTAVGAVVLEIHTSKNGPILDVSAVPNMAYAYSIVCALSTIVSAFFAIRQRNKWNPLLLLGMLNSAAVLTVLDYYMFYDANMLACLPILAAASLFVVLRRES